MSNPFHARRYAADIAAAFGWSRREILALEWGDMIEWWGEARRILDGEGD